MVVLSRQTAGFIATGILILYLFITPLDIIRVSDFKHDRLTTHEISSIEQRFKEIKKYLPIDTKVGYLSKNNMDINAKHPIPAKKFSVAQYAVIPTVLIIDTSPAIVIGDFDDDKTAKEIINQNNLQIAKDFHNGIYLLKHE